MKIVRLSPQLLREFVDLMTAIESDEASRLNFHPHGTFDSAGAMEEKLEEVVRNASGKDPYFLGFEDERAVAYGFLRGWAEGYADAFLGVAVRPEMQGSGYGRQMMNHLIDVAAATARQGASRELKLSVYQTNLRAIALYQSLGFALADHPRREGEFIGVLDLTPRVQA
jgi:ribosomal protein S18 acetylase RimI-like enzyme